MESAAETFEEVTANAHHSAKRAAGVTKSALSIALYKTCYGISYGAVYSSVFVFEWMSEGNTIRRGFAEGAEAAFEARKKAVERKPVRRPRAKRPVKARARVGKPVKMRAPDSAAAAA